jgi:uncharacterized iron-regulated membrane protein
VETLGRLEGDLLMAMTVAFVTAMAVVMIASAWWERRRRRSKRPGPSSDPSR